MKQKVKIPFLTLNLLGNLKKKISWMLLLITTSHSPTNITGRPILPFYALMNKFGRLTKNKPLMINTCLQQTGSFLYLFYSLF